MNPYIKEDGRKRLDFWLGTYEVYPHIIQTAGELNYLLIKIILVYLGYHGESYSRYNEIVGVLECVKQELYRRKISIYEDEKIKQNGDVF